MEVKTEARRGYSRAAWAAPDGGDPRARRRRMASTMSVTSAVSVTSVASTETDATVPAQPETASHTAPVRAVLIPLTAPGAAEDIAAPAAESHSSE